VHLKKRLLQQIIGDFGAACQMPQIPAHSRRELGVDLLKCFQRSALVTDHQGAEFLISFAHYSTLCRERRVCDRVPAGKSIFRNRVTGGMQRANIRQASETPPETRAGNTTSPKPATKLELNRGQSMKLLVPFLLSVFPLSSLAQSQPPSPQPPSGVLPPKTTDVMAILTVKQGVTRQQIMAVMPDEIRETVKLYLDGKIRQWYSRGDGKGVIFLIDAKTVDEARAIIDTLPLSKVNLMDHEYIPVGPLMPLAALIGAGPARQ
jgi:hypothetical protein